MSEYLIAFSSTQDGIMARVALRGHCRHTLLPTPRAVTASCGIAVLIPEDELSEALALLRGIRLFPDGASLYRVTGELANRVYTNVSPFEIPLP